MRFVFQEVAKSTVKTQIPRFNSFAVNWAILRLLVKWSLSWLEQRISFIYTNSWLLLRSTFVCYNWSMVSPKLVHRIWLRWTFLLFLIYKLSLPSLFLHLLTFFLFPPWRKWGYMILNLLSPSKFGLPIPVKHDLLCMSRYRTCSLTFNPDIVFNVSLW